MLGQYISHKNFSIYDLFLKGVWNGFLVDMWIVNGIVNISVVLLERITSSIKSLRSNRYYLKKKYVMSIRKIIVNLSYKLLLSFLITRLIKSTL